MSDRAIYAPVAVHSKFSFISAEVSLFSLHLHWTQITC